jgi:hypothetical protein
LAEGKQIFTEVCYYKERRLVYYTTSSGVPDPTFGVPLEREKVPVAGFEQKEDARSKGMHMVRLEKD